MSLHLRKGCKLCTKRLSGCIVFAFEVYIVSLLRHWKPVKEDGKASVRLDLLQVMSVHGAVMHSFYRSWCTCFGEGGVVEDTCTLLLLFRELVLA